jgi:mannan endo-1,6-alpha-mannosidase
MVEYACEPRGNCNRDQRSFKAYLSRWLAVSVQVAPFSAATITPWLQASAKAAVKVCTGGPPDGVVCGRKWWEDTDDGTRDVGNQMCAMSIVQANLVSKVPGIADVSTGTSVGNPGAGGGSRPVNQVNELADRQYGIGEKVGAWLITVFVTLVVLGIGVILCTDDFELAPISTWFKRG